MVLNSVVNPVLKNVAYEMSDWFLGEKKNKFIVWVVTCDVGLVFKEQVSVNLLHMGRNSGMTPSSNMWKSILWS